MVTVAEAKALWDLGRLQQMMWKFDALRAAVRAGDRLHIERAIP